MLDPLTSLAFSVQSNKGVYALLLGSGLSTAAGIPTGWEITLDLIQKIAVAAGEDCGTDPAAWYATKTGKGPDYSALFDALAKTPADRINLLSGYLEPTEDETNKKLKAPTAAHESIARLVSKGYIRVIVTTNFDRLIERALEGQGVSPTTISSADGARGALPLTHSRCTLVKLHGDYRDTRIRNTLAELETYDPELDGLLDRIFDEYGLIISGWSATWDKALCRALLRCPSRRFTTYWTRRSPLTEEARRLAVQRSAVEIEIDTADAFFSSVEAKIDAIDRYSEPHPLSTKLAVSALKRLIVTDENRIDLRDLVSRETEQTFKALSPLPLYIDGLSYEMILERMKVYEGTSETLVSLMGHGAFWGREQHLKLWSDVIARIGGLGGLRRGGAAMDNLLSLTAYPLCLLCYSAGIGALAAVRYEVLALICRGIAVRREGQTLEAIRAFLPWRVLNLEIARNLPGYKNRKTPISDRLFEVLREPLREFLPDDAEYEDTFDRFEYLACLVNWDVLRSADILVPPGVGRFGWKNAVGNKQVEASVSGEIARDGEDSVIIRSGMFPSVAKFEDVARAYGNGVLARVRTQW